MHPSHLQASGLLGALRPLRRRAVVTTWAWLADTGVPRSVWGCCGSALLCACAIGATLPPAYASEPGSTVEGARPPTVEPPVLTAQVALSYPEEALADELHADVFVDVDVDASGRVVGARVVDGPEVFHGAAEAGAYRLAFEPARQAGAAVASTTRVRFHFAPPTDPTDPVDDDAAIEIVVHGTDPDLEDVRARTTLDERDLERRAGEDLARSVEQVAGVRAAPGTSDNAKPIIRGQTERRLLVLNDGIRHESQKWGPDHATEIDPFSAGSISVIRGAAGARYGPDAIGGVILVEPPPLRSEPGVGGKLLTAYATNGRRPYAALRVDAVPEAAPGWTFRLQGNAALGATRRAPDYLLGNTASAVWNLGTTVGYRWDHGSVRASWHRHDFRAGVFYGVRNSSPADFEAQLAEDRPVTADLWSTTYTIDRAFQDVSHDRASLRTAVFGDWGTLEATYAFQLNRRLEFEQIRDQVEGPQYDFTLRTHSVDALYQHPRAHAGDVAFGGGLGLQGTFQENVYRGFGLVPDYRAFGGGVFGFERASWRRVDLEVGARFDALSRTSFLDEADYGRHERRGALDDETCDERDNGGARCPADYDTGSVSVGALVHAVPEHLDLKLDLSSASRFPNVDELFLSGSAPSFPVYGLGDPQLGVETAWSASGTAGLRVSWLTAEVSGYASLVDDYIYFAPDLNDAGEPRFNVTIRGAWPQYAYNPVDAWVHGADGSLTLGPTGPVGLEARGAFVRARERGSGEFLIGTPADHLHVGLVGRPRRFGPLRDLELAVTTDWVAQQTRTNLEADFAPPPDGYMLLGARADAVLPMGRTQVRIGVQAFNLLNTAYREYTSLLRYFADQPGRDVRVRIGTDF